MVLAPEKFMVLWKRHKRGSHKLCVGWGRWVRKCVTGKLSQTGWHFPEDLKELCRQLWWLYSMKGEC